MKKDLKNIDELFKEKLKNYEHPLPDVADKMIVSNWKKRKWRNNFFKAVSWFSFLVAIGFTGFILFYYQNTSLISNDESVHSVQPVIPYPFRPSGGGTFSFSQTVNSTHPCICNNKIHSLEKDTVFFSGSTELFKKIIYVYSTAEIQSVDVNSLLLATNRVLIQEVKSEASDFAPIISPDGKKLLFTSRRTVNNAGNTITGKENMFLSIWDEIRQCWSEATLLPSPFVSNEFNTSAVGFWDDKHLLFFRDDGRKGGDIFMVEWNNQEWGKPEKLPHLFNSKYLETSLARSPDGKMVVFSSNRPGGYGGLDLWYSVLDSKGKWSEPVNLGPEINTPENEEGVSFHPDGNIIFFHSSGLNGFGGYDVYFSMYDNGRWSKPFNLGQSVNSSDEDVYFILSPDRKTAYYSSGKSRDDVDLYKIVFKNELSFSYLSSLINPLTAIVVDVLDLFENKIPDANLVIESEDGNVMYAGKSEKRDNLIVPLLKGKKYLLTCWKNGYLPYVNWFEFDHFSEKVQKLTIKLDSLAIGIPFVVNDIANFSRSGSSKAKESYYSLLEKSFNQLLKDGHLIDIYVVKDSMTIHHVVLDESKLNGVLNNFFIDSLLKISTDGVLFYIHQGKNLKNQ